MDTKQKLTLGIAAIFMVTLTIVGVTYAYFVTRVTGGNTAITANTATIGDVTYVAGNGEKDIITLTDVLPGEAVYKTFSVKNENTDTKASASYFKIFTTNSVTDGKGEFIHTTGGLNTEAGVLLTCYGYQADTALDATIVQPKMSTELTTLIASGDTAAQTTKDLCFADAGIYNNIKLTLWQVDTLETSYTDDPEGSLVNLKTDKLTFNKTDDITDSISIDPKKTFNYVLKVEYIDAGYNQNAENLAGIDVLVSIKA